MYQRTIRNEAVQKRQKANSLEPVVDLFVLNDATALTKRQKVERR